MRKNRQSVVELGISGPLRRYIDRPEISNGKMPVHEFAFPFGHNSLRVDVSVLKLFFQIDDEVVSFRRLMPVSPMA